MSAPISLDPISPELESATLEPLPAVASPNEVDLTETNGALSPRGTETIQVLHLVNGEHYYGAERVQDLLARQPPTFGCEVGFACVKPRRFPAARESQQAPLVEMPMHGRFDLRVVKRIAELVQADGYDIVHAHTPRTALVGRL